MQLKNSLWVGLLSATLVLTGCAALAPEDDEQAQRLDELEDRLSQLERLVDSDSLVNLASQLDEVQAELRGMRGEIENLDYQLDGTAERQREIYLDVDRRLRRLEVGGAPEADQVPDVHLGQTPTDTPSEEGDPQAAYEEAFGLLRDGRYDAAGEAFEAFLEDHEDSDLGPNARYWLGEVHYVTRDYEQATAEFQRVLDDYPESNKLADSKLKLAFSYYELERWDEARDLLGEVRENYPDSSAARLANSRLNRMDEEGR
ncbi:tol-pal system protein YbgF [Natronospira proteinivora]|uniref:Cell division coordinator CpoB n=1 Tax=Natronospira proteinivora TaxID=1807133 RepID=A0ABT1G528_9GAMM|nr:tol-pal system protein YbgF [Natronospira proteinivora]MCP1726404.1 tol-pal system protein YbgF [Natronospira proteinivora]